MLVNSTNNDFFSHLPAAVSAGVTPGISFGVDDIERANLMPATKLRVPVRRERNFALSSRDHGYFAAARDAQILVGLRRIDVVHLSPGSQIKYHGRVGVLVKPPRASDGKSCVQFTQACKDTLPLSSTIQGFAANSSNLNVARAPSPSSVATPAMLATTAATNNCTALMQELARQSESRLENVDNNPTEWVTLSVQGLQLDEWCVLHEAGLSLDQDATPNSSGSCMRINPGASAWPMSKDNEHKEHNEGKVKKKNPKWGGRRKDLDSGKGKGMGQGKGNDETLAKRESANKAIHIHIDKSDRVSHPYTVVTRQLQTGPRAGRPYKRFHCYDSVSGTTKVFMSYRAMKQFWQLESVADTEARCIKSKASKCKVMTNAKDDEDIAVDDTDEHEEYETDTSREENDDQEESNGSSAYCESSEQERSYDALSACCRKNEHKQKQVTSSGRKGNITAKKVRIGQSSGRGNSRASSGYRGVTRRGKNGDRFEASMCFNGKYQFLGSYTSPEEAAKAYDRAVSKANPQNAILNFPSYARSRSSGGSPCVKKTEPIFKRRDLRAERRAKRSRTASDAHTVKSRRKITLGTRTDATFSSAVTPNRTVDNAAVYSIHHSPSGKSFNTQPTAEAGGARQLLSWNEYQKLHSGKHSRVLSREYKVYKRAQQRQHQHEL